MTDEEKSQILTQALENRRLAKEHKDNSFIKELCVAPDVFDELFPAKLAEDGGIKKGKLPGDLDDIGMPRLGLLEIDRDEHDRIASLGVAEDTLMAAGTWEFRNPMDMNGALVGMLFMNRHTRKK